SSGWPCHCCCRPTSGSPSAPTRPGGSPGWSDGWGSGTSGADHLDEERVKVRPGLPGELVAGAARVGADHGRIGVPDEGSVDDDGEISRSVEPGAPVGGIGRGTIPLERPTGDREGSIDQLPDCAGRAGAEDVVPVAR